MTASCGNHRALETVGVVSRFEHPWVIIDQTGGACPNFGVSERFTPIRALDPGPYRRRRTIAEPSVTEPEVRRGCKPHLVPVSGSHGDP